MEESIEQGNRLIAEFGGWKFYPNKRKSKSCWSKPGVSWKGVDPPTFEHHWELLMPVVEKIEGKETDLNISVVIKNDKCRVYRHKNSPYEMVVSDLHEGTTKIEATWKSVIQFIQWYNTSSNTKQLNK